MTISAKEMADLKAVLGDAAKFSLDEQALFNDRLREAQDSGEVVTFAPRQVQLIRAALMCFIFKDELVRMAERLDIPCHGCPGCATGDCPDALDVAANCIAELAAKNTRQDHAFAHEVEQGTEWRNHRDRLEAAFQRILDMPRRVRTGKLCRQVAKEALNVGDEE